MHAINTICFLLQAVLSEGSKTEVVCVEKKSSRWWLASVIMYWDGNKSFTVRLFSLFTCNPLWLANLGAYWRKFMRYTVDYKWWLSRGQNARRDLHSFRSVGMVRLGGQYAQSELGSEIPSAKTLDRIWKQIGSPQLARQRQSELPSSLLLMVGGCRTPHVWVW